MVRIAFAGDRGISVQVLEFLISQGARPELLLIPDDELATHAAELVDLAGLPDEKVLRGDEFRTVEGNAALHSAEVDYLIGVHFAYIIPSDVLSIPNIGCINLHPAFLPYNAGWHTPSWAILDGTPAGATLHFMSEGLDSGDIIAQQELTVNPDATADTLYQQLLALELSVFKRAWPLLASGDPPRRSQNLELRTSHSKADLFHDKVRELDLDKSQPIGDTLRQLRGLTTNQPEEAAYFVIDGIKYLVRVEIIPDS